MVEFIASRIEMQAEISTTNGIKKYKAYFVNTKIYKAYRDDVDTILRTDGYEDVIVED